MSPTVDSSALKPGHPMLYQYPPIRKKGKQSSDNAAITTASTVATSGDITDSVSIPRSEGGQEQHASSAHAATGHPLSNGTHIHGVLSDRAHINSRATGTVSSTSRQGPALTSSQLGPSAPFHDQSDSPYHASSASRFDQLLKYPALTPGAPRMTKTQSDTTALSSSTSSPSTSNDSGQGVDASEHVSYQFFHLEPCLYTHRMFTRAAKIFRVLKDDELETPEFKAQRRRQGGVRLVDETKIPEMDFLDAQEQRKTFELTFATLKYQNLFHEILDRTGFFLDYPEFRDDYSMVCILLYDFQTRKFQKRIPFPDEELDPVCTELENALLKKKTRLLSSIAKERIKNNAPAIEYLLPEQVRDKDETKAKTPVYLWVNQFRRTVADMVEVLESEGFTAIGPEVDISEETGMVYRLDPHCCDLFTFPPHLDMFFKDSVWVKEGLLVPQDKSSCLAPQSVQYLLGLDQDVIHVNTGTGMTTAHVASLLRRESSHSHVWGFGMDGADKAKKAMGNLEFLGVRNTKILVEDFLQSDPEEPKFRNVRVALITANCSKSAITSPVQFIVSEGEDMQLLGELSKAETDMDQVASLTTDHKALLNHALKFPKLQAVVYSTRSRHEAENEHVVTQVLEYLSQAPGRKLPFKLAPPVLPFAGTEIDSGLSGVDGRFVRFIPTDKSNGCFVAVLSREPEDPKEAARNAIARAKSKGMLGKGEHHGEDGEDDQADLSDTERVTNHASEVKVKATKSGTSKSSSNRKLKGATSLPEVKSAQGGGSHPQKSKSHKTPAAIGARLYQAGLLARIEQVSKTKEHKPEHIKVVKHPAPFR